MVGCHRAVRPSPPGIWLHLQDEQPLRRHVHPGTAEHLAVAAQIEELHAHIGMLVVPVGDQLRHDPLHRVDGDGEADARTRAAGADDLRVDAEDMPFQIEQWPAGLPGLIAASVWMASPMK